VIVYVPKSSGKKYLPATTPPMNSAAAASFIVGSGNQRKNPFRPKTKRRGREGRAQL
jgi:hypothetical protein